MVVVVAGLAIGFALCLMVPDRFFADVDPHEVPFIPDSDEEDGQIQARAEAAEQREAARGERLERMRRGGLRHTWQEMGQDLYDVAPGPRHSEFSWFHCIVKVKACGALKKDLTNTNRMYEHYIYVRIPMPTDFHTLKRTLEAAWDSPEPIKIKSGREELGPGSLDNRAAVRDAAFRHLSAYYDRDYDQLRDDYVARVRDAGHSPRVAKWESRRGTKRQSRSGTKRQSRRGTKSCRCIALSPFTQTRLWASTW